MIQNVIAYILIGVAIGYAIYSVVKKFRSSDKEDCSDCNCCGKKCKKI
ncbi:MAG: FeoB-associated Cys-rich membrane protein [Bacteroidales bacterium]|nr:FeoB-associated Cys-rich membrane protein [Bacteroidales bacterium]